MMVPRMLLAPSLVHLRKKLTVMRVMGRTQGVNNASNSSADPIRSRNHSELFCSLRPSCCYDSWMAGCHKSVPTVTWLVSTDAGRGVFAVVVYMESGLRGEGESVSLISLSVGSYDVAVASMADDFLIFL